MLLCCLYPIEALRLPVIQIPVIIKGVVVGGPVKIYAQICDPVKIYAQIYLQAPAE